jgi:thiol-disulfide isomerase/thioredoxin
MVHRNARGRFAAQPAIDVRNKKQIPALEKMLKGQGVTFVLIYADWCGHCQRFKPTWAKYAQTPGRTANIASVHHDMQALSPTLKNAQIEGYPSVVRVLPSGKLAEFQSPAGVTNAIQNMRDEQAMVAELTSPDNMPRTARFAPPPMQARRVQPAARAAAAAPAAVTRRRVAAPLPPAKADRGEAGAQFFGSGDEGQWGAVQGGGARAAGQVGGSMAAAFLTAIQSVGPAALLLAAHSMLPRSRRTYRSPKKSSRRASTRKNRGT